jgi:hypothetical protein
LALGERAYTHPCRDICHFQPPVKTEVRIRDEPLEKRQDVWPGRVAGCRPGHQPPQVQVFSIERSLYGARKHAIIVDADISRRLLRDCVVDRRPQQVRHRLLRLRRTR